MEDCDCLHPPGWWRQFKPPDYAKSNEEVLQPFYDALEACPSDTKLHCAIKFRAIKYGLIQDSLELSGIDKNAQGQSYWEQCKDKLFSSYQPHGTRARQPMTCRPVNLRRGFSRDEWASIVNAVTKRPVLDELEIEVQRDIDSTIIEDLLSRLPALRVLGLQIWTGFSEACIPEVAKSIRRMKTLERLLLYSREVLNYREPGGMESILIEHLFPSVSSPNVSEIEDQSMLNELQWRYRGPIPWRYKCLYEVVIILLRNSRLKTVELHEQVYIGASFWSYKDLIGIFETLQGNKFLKKLDMTFSGIKVKESEKDVTREIVGNLLDLVGHDFYVEEICFPLQLCDEFQRVVTQVKKNGADALKGMELINPISSRVFLCGLPYAGKTQLRTTFGKEPTTFGKKHEFLKQLIYPDKDIPRTSGIEVTNIDARVAKFSFWDFGGQVDYHFLHDLFIPSNCESGSSFVILCSLVAKKDEKVIFKDGRKKEITFKSEDAIKEELVYWLRFIVSNSKMSVKFKPFITLVFSHADFAPKGQIANIKDTVG